MKRPGDPNPEPTGGRAAERLKMYEEAREPAENPVSESSSDDAPTTAPTTAPPEKRNPTEKNGNRRGHRP